MVSELGTIRRGSGVGLEYSKLCQRRVVREDQRNSYPESGVVSVDGPLYEERDSRGPKGLVGRFYRNTPP